VDTAIRLFREHGYHATGIDKIIAEAGVSKMTLYKHFRSKDELILTALQVWDEESRAWLANAIEQRAQSPRERLLALFDVLDEWFANSDFTGCMFINAIAEFARQQDPIHLAAAQHKRLFRDYIRQLARAAGAQDPDVLGDHISLLMEGCIVTAHAMGKSNIGAKARVAAEVLIERALAS
jgi:AcrR family transcriptional regulator